MADRIDKIIGWCNIELIRRDPDIKEKETSASDLKDYIHEMTHTEGGSYVKWLNSHKFLSGQCHPIERDIFTSVNSEYLFDCRDGRLEVDLFLLHAAVRSVCGKRNFAKGYRENLVQRMYDDRVVLSRWKFDRLFDRAQARHLCSRVPAGNGWFISVRYNRKELEAAIKTRVEKYEQALNGPSENLHVNTKENLHVNTSETSHDSHLTHT